MTQWDQSARRRGEVSHPDGTTVAFDVEGDGPPVVFVHGLTNSRHGWTPVTDILRKRLTCVRVDLRGHGESSMADDYSMLALVSDVHAIVSQMDLRLPAIIGHSLGGSVAAIYAVLHPARAVVVVDQTLRIGDFAQRVQRYAEQLHGDRCMSAVLQIERDLGIGPSLRPGDLEERVLRFPPEVVRGIWADVLATPPDDLNRLMEATLPALSVPLLALHGSEQQADYGGWLKRLVAGAEVEVWDGAGHFLHLVDPERFAGRVLEFVEFSP